MDRVELEIEGMSCGHCVGAVRKALLSVEGVTPESVSVGRAGVSFDPARADPSKILESVRKAGYDAHVVPAGAQ